MATAHQVALSYLSFTELWDIISDDDTWTLFEPYFPPKDNVKIKIAEVRTIRNRTAHFRDPHTRDTARLKLFMEDMEPGIRRFCNRYTQEKILLDPSHDPVTNALALIWERVGYGIELMCPGGWLYAPGHYRDNPLMNARLEILARNPSLEGIVYRVSVQRGKRSGQPSDTVQLFECTKHFHADIIHFLISSFGDEVSITVPAILGVEKTTDLIGDFLRAGLEASRGYPQSMDTTKLEWPEYVLWPSHMINIFCPEMQDAILLLE